MTASTGLRIASAVEALSLLLLLTNLATVHISQIAALAGPIHGAAYLVVIATTFLLPAAPRRGRWLSLVPGIGGVLVLRAVAVQATPGSTR